MLEIVAGVASGELVVTSAQFMFDSESRLREAINKMLEPEKGKASDTGDAENLFEDETPASKAKLEELF